MNQHTTSPEYRRWKSQFDTDPMPSHRIITVDGLDEQPRSQPSHERAGNKPEAYFYSQRIALLGAYEQLILERRRHRQKMARRRDRLEMVL